MGCGRTVGFVGGAKHSTKVGLLTKGKGSHNYTGTDVADRQEGGRPGQAWLKVARPACTGSTFFVLVFRPLSFLANSYSFLVLSVLFCPFYSFLG